MTQAKHTPGPYSYRPNGIGYFNIMADGMIVAASVALETDAAFIVRACNSHDELVEALESLVRQQEDVFKGGSVNADLKPAYAALAKAEGGQP